MTLPLLQQRRRLVASALILSVLLYPTVSAWAFKLREPMFLAPLSSARAIQIRKDPYGSGLFGAPRSGGRRHRGVDLVAPVGTQVLASKSGVARIGRKRNGMGRYVEVKHPDGWMSRYGHLKRITIRDGQRLRRGAFLGMVGKTGNAKRRLIQPHLHFEVWTREGKPIDPLTVMEAATSD